MTGGALGYARRLMRGRRAARVGMFATLALAVVVGLLLAAIGWGGASVTGVIAGVVVIGCLVTCIVVWSMEAHASREFQRQIDTLVQNRTGASPHPDQRDG